MRPSQEFRFWARRAPTVERVAAGVAVATVMALLVWLLVPAGTHSGAQVSSAGSSGSNGAAAGPSDSLIAPGGAVGAGGSAAGQPGAGAGAGAGTGAGSRNAGNATGAAGASAARQGCASPPGSAPGVTATQIKVAVAVTNIVGPAGNSTFGIPSADEQHAAYQAVIDDVNKHGGVACRQLAPTFYVVNPVDQAAEQQLCLDIAQAGSFAVFDTGSLSVGPGIPACFAQHHVAFFSAIALEEGTIRQFFPYLFAMGSYQELYHSAAFGLAARGAFDPARGFKKLGYIYHDCFKEAVDAYRGWLRDAGVPDALVVTYNVGCASGFASPSDIQQAIIKFQREGVTHFTEAQFTGDFATFTNVAQQQGFHPTYVIPDDAIMATSYGSSRPNADNIDGAVAITITAGGEEHTPGIPPSPGTVRCDTVLKPLGRPTVRQVGVDALGDACDLIWMFQAAVEHAPSLQPAALPVGLQRARSVEFSYPQGPNDFGGGPSVTYAGQFWRPTQFSKGCTCWHLLDPAFHRG
jgi:hypothetical protein